MVRSTSQPPRSERRLLIDAELTLARGDVTFDVWTEDDRLVVNAPSIVSLRHLRSLSATVRSTLVGVGSLPDTPPPVEFRVRHATVATVGPGAAVTGGTEKLTGFPSTVSARGLLIAAWRALN